MANFPEMLEQIDDQMMIEALEDFEVSIFTNIVIFQKDCVLNTDWFNYRKPKQRRRAERRRRRTRTERLNL